MCTSMHVVYAHIRVSKHVVCVCDAWNNMYVSLFVCPLRFVCGHPCSSQFDDTALDLAETAEVRAAFREHGYEREEEVKTGCFGCFVKRQ